MAAEYPANIKTFNTKDPGDPIKSAHINELQNEVVAVETQLVTSKLASLSAAPVGNKVLTSVAGVPTWAAKAPDSDLLDGLDSTDFVLASEIGVWQDWTPTVTFEGGTTDPPAITKYHARYTTIGKIVIASADYYFGLGGDRTQYKFTLPLTPSGLTYGAVTAYETLKATFTEPTKASMTASGAYVTVYVPLQDKNGHVMFTAIYEIA